MGGATGWRLLQDNREVLNWTQTLEELYNQVFWSIMIMESVYIYVYIFISIHPVVLKGAGKHIAILIW